MAQVTDFTKGKLFRPIVRFSIPIIFSNVLQLAFNAADMVVLGRFAGENGLASVGAVSFLVSLFTLFLVGISIGVNVLVSQYVGAGGYEREIEKTIHTAITIGFIGGIGMAVAGQIFSDSLLDLVNVPDNVRAGSSLYMRICLMGAPFIAVYNYGASAMRAIGDAKRPLYVLVSGGIINVILNVFFVVVLNMEVAGVAIATVSSHIINSLIILIILIKEKSVIRFSFKKIGIDRGALVRLIRNGLPAAFQSSLFSISNIAIQSGINAYGPVLIAANSAALNIEGFLYFSLNAFAQSTLTVVSQNFGARNWDRIHRSLRIIMGLIICMGLAEGVFAYFARFFLVSIYNTNPDVIREGAIHIIVVGIWYFIFGIVDMLVSAVRGCGHSVAPTAINLLGICAFRVLWVLILDIPRVSILWIYASYPISWILVLIALICVWIRIAKNLR